MGKVAINSIVVNDRIRKDFGDISGLAADIKENGLLQPVVVSDDMVLLCGERRLRACKELGMDEIDAVVKSPADAHQALMMEVAENENRKEFSVSERLAYAAKLMPIVQEEAKDRSGGAVKERKAQGRSRDIVAKEVGFSSGETYRRAKKVADSGNDELVAAMDSGEISINGAYEELQKLQAKVKQQEEELAEKEATIKSYEEAEDEQSDAYENLMLQYSDLAAKYKAAMASSDYHDREVITQNVIDAANKERDEAIRQRDDALDKLEKRVRPVVESDPAAKAYVELGVAVSEAGDKSRKEIASILNEALKKIAALSS